MNMRMKKILKEALEAPAPVNKQDFLRKIPAQRVSMLSFMVSQAGYLRKRVWIISIVPVILGLAGACFLDRNLLWPVSAFMPLIALSALTENFRSEAYGMEELEMSSRFSLRSVVLARMGILGVLHLILLCLLLPIVHMHGIFTVLQTGIYLLIPYLLTDVLDLWVIRTIRGKEGFYVCTGVAVCISCMYSFLRAALVKVLFISYFEWMMAILVALAVLCIWEMKKMVQMTEELRWSLS